VHLFIIHFRNEIPNKLNSFQALLSGQWDISPRERICLSSRSSLKWLVEAGLAEGCAELGSYSQDFPYICPNGHQGSMEIWLVVDGAERSDLLRLAAAGELAPPVCPKCRAPVDVGELSLMVYRPDRRPEILFGSTSPQDDTLTRRQITMSALVLNQGHDHPVGGHGRAIPVPYDLITIMVPRDIDADAATLDAGGFSAPSPALQRYREWLSGYAYERFKQASMPIVLRLLQAESPSALRQIIEENPVLFDQRVDSMLGGTAEAAADDGHPEMAYVARHRRDTLRRVREVGIDKVFPPGPPPPPPRAEVKVTYDENLARAPRLSPEEEATPSPELAAAIGSAMMVIAGIPVGDPPTRPDRDRRRKVLEDTLAQLTPREDSLAVEYGDEFIPVRSFISRSLAEELLAAPRDRNDILQAQHLLQDIPLPRRAWAHARHNLAAVMAKLAPPGDIDALDAARAEYERALTVRTRDESPDEWAETTSAIANLLYTAYPDHDPRYLDEAVAMLEDALADPPPGLSERARLRLALSRASGAMKKGDLRDDAAALRDAADALPAIMAEAERLGDDECARVAQTNIGRALSLLAEHTGLREDWHNAVSVLRAAFEAHEATEDQDEEQWAAPAINLSVALYRSGDIEAAVPLMRRIVERTAASGLWSAWASTQNNLGSALLARSAGDHDENIDQAINAYGSARRVWTRKKFPVDWALTTARLALAYEAKGERDRPGTLLREAIDLVPRAERPVEWARLANRLAPYEPPHAALERYQAAAEILTGNDFPHEWSGIQHNIGNLYSRVAREPPDGSDADSYLAAAIRYYQQALDARPASEDPVRWAETATALGDALRRMGMWAEAVPVLRQALQVLRAGGPAERVITAASSLGYALSEDEQWAEAATAFQEAIDAADRRYATSLLRSTREQVISEHDWLFIALAFCRVRQGRPAEAVDALEHGRTRLLGEALSLDLDRVTAAQASGPEQYAAYTTAVRRLAAAEAASTRLMTPAPIGTTDSSYHRQAEQDARNELRAARAAFDQASSRLPEPPSSEREQPRDSIIAYLFTSSRDCTALLAGPDRVESMALPGVNTPLMRRLVRDVLRAQGGPRRELRSAVGEALRIVGDLVMTPVMDAMRGATERSVIVVPVGEFAALPLHAAPVTAEGHCLLDYFAVSYAPSAAVLAAARRSARHRVGEPGGRGGIAIIDPGAGLPFADCEADTMLRLTGGHRVNAASGTILEELADPAARYVHFACHGQSVPEQPLDSHLAFGRGRRLTLMDLLAGDHQDVLRGARLVVASACQTAVTDMARVPDEFVGLAAGFLTAGVPCFVGTLWPSADIPSALVMSRFYQLMAGGLTCGEALRQAQLWLRDLDGAGLHAYLMANPGIAAVRPHLAEIAESRPDQRFYADPVSWAPYVVIGDATIGGLSDE
jgi:CHAT domain-containing protein/tetratricopeptide (TPR) repeat protein